MVLARVRKGAESLHFKFFPISVEGHRKSIFSQIQKSPNYPKGGGQENYGLFPQIMVFFILNRPLSKKFWWFISDSFDTD